MSRLAIGASRLRVDCGLTGWTGDHWGFHGAASATVERPDGAEIHIGERLLQVQFALHVP
ncbi:MAG: hypothetical protein F4Z23_10265 [Acidimicrobiaceae bacterium]|nr:hypothetical protein [Acidimicrobiaceae bacterium]